MDLCQVERVEGHLHYETVAMHAGVEIDSGIVKLKDSAYRVEKCATAKPQSPKW